MKSRDRILFAAPLAAGLLIAGLALILYRHIAGFEEARMAEARRNLELSTELAAGIVRPLLAAGECDAAAAFCETFDRSSVIRLSLIDSAGRVRGDSGKKAGLLGNHRTRTEVNAALTGQPGGAERFSESMNRRMIYYAVPVGTGSAEFVLRGAVDTARVRELVDSARLNVFLGLVSGGVLVLVFAVYLFSGVRRPLLKLQDSAAQIAAGRLDCHIEIPRSGLLRELAMCVSEMAEQLKGRLAEATAERNEKLTVFNSMSEAVMTFAPDGGIVTCNCAAAEMFGLASTDAKFDLARCGIPELLPRARRTMLTGEPFEREFERGEDGRTLFVKGRLLNSGGRNLLLLTITDLTGLRKLESFRSDFIANVSHEIRTPLTCIMGAAETLGDDAVPPEMRTRMLEILNKQAKRLNDLVQDILSLAALERRQRDPSGDFVEINLEPVLVNAANLWLRRAAECGVELKTATLEPLSVNGDGRLIEQAVTNLIGNALKYSGSPKIELALRRDGEYAVLLVRDFGCGIPPEHRDRIFERFYRVHKERSRELGGTGLGLAIVKHIAQLHRGTAELRSPDNGGCEFIIRIPLLIAGASADGGGA
ncbi:MAG: ATP-binding protein [Victivallaceae bacterium]|nr:ATP-binding protein [Victivallaceae bacterium]